MYDIAPTMRTTPVTPPMTPPTIAPVLSEDPSELTCVDVEEAELEVKLVVDGMDVEDSESEEE